MFKTSMAFLKKATFLVISIILVICAICTFRLSNDSSPEPVIGWKEDELMDSSVIPEGFSAEWYEDRQCTVFMKKTDYPNIQFKLDGVEFNTIIIKFAQPVRSSIGNTFRMNCNYIGDMQYDDEITYGQISSDRKLLYFSLPKTINSEYVKLNIHGTCSIEEVSVYNIDGQDTYSEFNPVALEIFFVIIVLLALVEIKFGYFRWIINSVKNFIRVAKGYFREDIRGFIIYVLSRVSTVALLLTVLWAIAYNRYSPQIIVVVFLLSILSVVLQLVDRIRSGKGNAPATLYLVVAVILGVMMCYTSPVSTHSAWDDEIHLHRAYLTVNSEDDEPSLAKARLFAHTYRVSDYIKDPSTFINTMVAESNLEVNYEFEKTTAYTMVSYLPTLVSISLTELLNMDLVNMLTICRLFNLLAYVGITYLGIRKLKSGAYIFSAICLMPAVLYLGCSINYDFWLTAWITYAIAYIISEIQQPQKVLKASDLIKILGAFFLGCAAKPVYCVMLFPMFFLGKSKFKSRAHRNAVRILVAAVALLIALLMIAPEILSPDFYTDERGGGNVSSTYQIRYILTNPLEFIDTLVNEMDHFCSLSEFNGYAAKMGYLDGYSESVLLMFGSISLFIIVFSMFIDKNDNDNFISADMKKFRLTYIFTFFVQVAVICVSLYVIFNNVGTTVINGVQFRYIFPLLPCLFFVLKPGKFHYSASAKLYSTVVFGGLTANLILSYYFAYIHNFAFSLFIGETLYV